MGWINQWDIKGYQQLTSKIESHSDDLKEENQISDELGSKIEGIKDFSQNIIEN